MHITKSSTTEAAAVASSSAPSLRGLLFGLFSLLACDLAVAHGGSVVAHRLPAIEVRGELPAPPAGVASIKFGEFFRMPVGPRGLEASEKLLALNGKRVRLVGYMVQEESAAPGRFLLSPLPVALGDADEALADDLPPSTVFVHLQGAGDRSTPYVPGLVKLVGVLELGPVDEDAGRVSTVRLKLDRQTSRQILSARPMQRASSR